MTPKQLIRTISILLIVVSSACSKKPGEIVVPTPIPTPVGNISKIEREHYSVEVSYHANGSIATLSNKAIPADPNDVIDFSFIYQGEKLDEAIFEGKWKYYYTGNQVTKVATHNAAGVAKYQTSFLYNNNRVVEKMESIITSVGDKPQFHYLYTYHADGNLAKKEVYEMVNNAWQKSEEVSYPAYDTYLNLGQVLEGHPYVPTALYFTNNPLKEIFTDKSGIVTETVTYTYTYDNKGRVTTRTAKHVYDGFPDFVETIKMFY